MAIFKANSIKRGKDACRSAREKASLRYIQNCDGNAIVFALRGEFSKQTARYRASPAEEGRGA